MLVTILIAQVRVEVKVLEVAKSIKIFYVLVHAIRQVAISRRVIKLKLSPSRSEFHWLKKQATNK